MIDLHVHSTFSDGTLTPTALVAKARAMGLRALALTDHDCTAGLPEFLDAAASAGRGADPRFTGIAGVEISAEVSPGTPALRTSCGASARAGRAATTRSWPS